MSETTTTPHNLSLGDSTLAFVMMGTGPAVVIVHGVGGHKEDWLGVANGLAARHRVFAIDMLGFGGSSKHGADLSMPVQADAIKTMLDHFGIAQADLVGNSVGGWVAASFAAAYPDRVRRLILIDPAGFQAMFEGPPPVNFDPATEAEMQALINITINSAVAQTPGLAAAALAAYIASGEKAVSASWGKSLFLSPRLETILPRIRAATLLLWGQDDRLFPAELASVLADYIDGARVQLISDAGHFPQIDKPAETLDAIAAFLA